MRDGTPAARDRTAGTAAAHSQRVAVFGAAGQLGSDLVTRLRGRAIPLTRAEADITDAASVARALDAHSPDVVINAAADNLVDAAESHPEAAFRGNAFAPRILAQACQSRSIPLVHISTDFVFGLDAARRTPYAESDLPAPVNVYGVSKFAGEALVRLTSDDHLIVRTCGLYGTAAGSKGNFVRTIRRLATTQTELRVVGDQCCTPTSTADLADALLKLLAAGARGTFHLTNAGDCSWCEFACAIVQGLDLPANVIEVTSDQFPRPARRPAYSVLDCSRAARLLGGPLRRWEEALSDYLRTLPP